jgi:putative iron-dependent peroxidase
MSQAQNAILSGETRLARYMYFNLVDIEGIEECLSSMKEWVDGESTVIGFGASFVAALGKEVPGLKNMPVNLGKGIDIPSTPASLWLWLRGDDRGEIYHRSRFFENELTPNFEITDVVDSFQYSENRDLSGYEDGTENPEGDEAVEAAILQEGGDGLAGSSFVAVQQWLHDFDAFDLMTESEQDDMIGRHISDNEEFDEAPESAHVKRAAQESYEPEAFIVRRSMPWADGMSSGLVFVAFGKSFDAFEAILNRMLGHEDDIRDGLFQFTHPVTGAYFWCPPMKSGQLDLSRLGIA